VIGCVPYVHVSAHLQVDVTSILLDEAVRRSTQQKLHTQLLEDGALDGTAEDSLSAAPATLSPGLVLAQVIAKLRCCKLSKGRAGACGEGYASQLASLDIVLL
jgi:hypothetical protein